MYTMTLILTSKEINYFLDFKKEPSISKPEIKVVSSCTLTVVKFVPKSIFYRDSFVKTIL